MKRSRPLDAPRVAGGAGPPLSQHPVDRLVRELLQAGRQATAAEMQQILARFAAAPFPTASPHLAKRINERQWTITTTPAEYEGDLRRAILDPLSHLAIFVRRGGHLAAVIADTRRVVPVDRQGPVTLPLLLAVYSADRGMILTGYQATNLGTISLPKDARWLT